MQTIGIRLAELMKLNDKKQADIAGIIGVSSVAVGQYCRSETLPSIENLIKIADYFDVSTDYLLGRTDVKTTDTTIKGICEYTGLSEKVVKAMHKNPHAFIGEITSGILKYFGDLFDIQNVKAVRR